MDADRREIILADARKSLDAGDVAGALASLEPYLARYPADAAANALAGSCWAQVGDNLKAERHLKISVAVDDSQFGVKRLLLSALMNLYKWDEAYPLAEELRREDPNDRIIQVMLESAKENLGVSDPDWKPARTVDVLDGEDLGGAR
jgi:predicted Zn-dependent protease